jgi:hypothetical protein
MDLADLERRVRALEDTEAIKQLKYRYADACDRGLRRQRPGRPLH